MALLINIRHLRKRPLRLTGELTVEELEIETFDQMIRVGRPLHYELILEKLGESLLVQGRLRLVLDCQCVRCLEPFEQVVEVREASLHLALAGAEGVPVVNDCVDLTPYVREDILLAFPQHPTCRPECRGISIPQKFTDVTRGNTRRPGGKPPSAWTELNKLKF